MWIKPADIHSQALEVWNQPERAGMWDEIMFIEQQSPLRNEQAIENLKWILFQLNHQLECGCAYTAGSDAAGNLWKASS